MGYELHITRAEQYYNSEEHPITLTEWLTYAEGHPELSEAGWVGWDDGRVPVYAHTCADGSVVSLTWFEGQVAIKGHFTGDPAQEFGALAIDLQANLLGDEGERYTAAGVLPAK